jgi:hypothetical protein
MFAWVRALSAQWNGIDDGAIGMLRLEETSARVLEVDLR